MHDELVVSVPDVQEGSIDFIGVNYMLSQQLFGFKFVRRLGLKLLVDE